MSVESVKALLFDHCEDKSHVLGFLKMVSRTHKLPSFVHNNRGWLCAYNIFNARNGLYLMARPTDWQSWSDNLDEPQHLAKVKTTNLVNLLIVIHE